MHTDDSPNAPEGPRLSRAGNPLPPLPPLDPDADELPPLDMSRLPETGPRMRPDRYRYVTPNPKYPKLPLYVAPKSPHETEAQYAVYREDIEHFHHDHTIGILYVMQTLCTHIGNHKTCARRTCRRRGRCEGKRDVHDVGGSLVMVPPCVPLDIEIIWMYFEEVRRELRRMAAGVDARNDEHAASGQTS